MSCSAFLLLLLISAAWGQLQIHFEKSEYTFPESRRVCVKVVSVGGAASEHFSISYNFDPVLIGQNSGMDFPATQLFPKGASSVKLCLPGEGGRDNQVCESDTHGTITLINSSTIRLVEPYIARITVTDDEFFASFDQPAYTFLEGSGTQHLTLSINSGLSKSINFNLSPEPEPDVRSLTLQSRILSYEPGSQTAGIMIELIDNLQALEQPRQVSLGIILSSSECYNLTITPTIITILDNDVVTFGFTNDELTVREHEGEVRICVSISHTIAQPLNFIIIYDSIIAENQAKGGSILGQLPAHSNSSGSCYTVQFLQDNIKGNNRYFHAHLVIDESSYPSGVVIANSSLKVIIWDSSECYNVDIVNASEDIIEVPSLSSVCFYCHFKEGKSEDIRWKIGGLVLQSDVGEVLLNGTLQVTNSSNVFHSTTVLSMSCSNGEDGEEFSFSVALEGEAVNAPSNAPSKSFASTPYVLDGIMTLLIFIALFPSL